MKIGERIELWGKIYTAVKKHDSLDYEGLPETEIELRSDDGDTRFFSEWLCEEWIEIDKAKGKVY